VEGAVERHDGAALAGLASAFQRRLDGLGPGVREEHLATERGFGEPASEHRHRLGVVEVANMQQAPGLLADRGDDGRMAVPDAGDGDAGEEVEVLDAA
jgi:hypothetical protein